MLALASTLGGAAADETSQTTSFQPTSPWFAASQWVHVVDDRFGFVCGP